MGKKGNISIIELSKRNPRTFESLFFNYSEGLVRFAESYLFDRGEAEDVVQNLFTYLWDNADSIQINSSIKAYLYQSTRNRCLNVIRNLDIQDKHQLMYLEAMIDSQSLGNEFDDELFQKLDYAISQLPERMLEIFKLKYIEGKRISQISENLQVSENTVKTQLKRAREKITRMMVPILLVVAFLNAKG